MALLPVVLSMSITIGDRHHAQAAVQIPKALSTQDQAEIVRVLGPGTAAKSMSSPYSLGGYTGLEVSVLVDSLDTSSFASLGDRLATAQPNNSVPKLSVGKGLYGDLDVFLQFSPYNKATEVSQFGALARWSFFEAASLPVASTLQLHMTNANFSNLVNTQTSGVDWLTGIQVDDISLYGGLGWMRVSGRFVGGTAGVTATQTEQVTEFSALRVQAGANLRYNALTFGLQLDRVTTSHLSFKVGFLF